MEIIKNIAAVIGCITAAIGLIGIIFKPIRKGISDWIKKIIGSSESANAIKRIDVSLLALDGKIDSLYEQVEKLDQRVFENERDRIKADKQRQDRQRHQKVCSFFLIFHCRPPPIRFRALLRNPEPS